MNTSKDSIPEMKTLGIAEEWIRYLRKKNTFLSILLLMISLVAVGASGLAYKHYTELAYYNDKQGLLRHDLSSVELERDRLSEKNTELTQQLEALNEELTMARTEIDTQTKLNAEKAQLSDQMLSALKEKNQMLELSAAETEREYQEMQAILGKKVGVSKDLTNKLEQYRSANKKLQTSTKKLEKDLSARRVAYTALVGRLKDANYDLDQTKAELVKLKSENSRLEQLNQAYQVSERQASETIGIAKAELQTKEEPVVPAQSEKSSAVVSSQAGNEPFAIQDERPKKARVVFENPNETDTRTIDSANQIVLQ